MAELLDNYLGMADPSLGPSFYSGGIADQINNRNFLNMRRPYYDKHGRPSVTVNTGRWTKADSRGGEAKPILEHRLVRDLINNGIMSPVFNATALRKEEWTQLDTVVLRAARYRLRAWSDLAAANSYGGFNAMGKTILEHETMTDPGEAVVDMDGLAEGRTDSPKFQLEGLPLPITHSDFWFSARKLAISRHSGTPLDSTMGEAAGRRVAETIEKTTIGVTTGITYGGNSTQVGGYGRTSSVYGYTNFPARLTKTNLTTPTGSNTQSTLNDVLAMRQSLMNNKFYGPYMIYTSNDWDTFLDADYYVGTGAGVTAPTRTLRERLKMIEGILDIRRLDFLFATALDPNTDSTAYKGPGTDVDVTLKPFTMIMVQMTPDVCRAVNGMDVTTIQWESLGGLRLNFKVMAIQVPQLRADAYSNAGLLHATTT